MRLPGRRLPLLLATALAAGVLGAATTSAPSQAATAPSPAAVPASPASSQAATPPSPAATAVPNLQWGECPDAVLDPEPGFQCATAAVPLDYADPGGATIGLALKRRPADDPEHRIGSLFLNPGGPGGSGVDFVSMAPYVYGPEVLARFDVVGFDPRGVARSSPLVCFDDEEQVFQTFAFLPPFPRTAGEERQFTDAYASYTARCKDKRQAVLDHMSTGNVARDLDLLRAAVGDDKLTYIGYSYGTQLGTTYANMFPENVRAIVLDGVLDPVAWTTGETRAEAGRLPYSARLGSADGAYATLQQFFARCEEAGGQTCPFAVLGDPKRTYGDLAKRLEKDPVFLPLGFGLYQRFGYPELVATTLSALYDPSAWPFLAQLLVDLQQASNPDQAARHWQQLRARLGLDDGTQPAPEQDQPLQTVEGFDGVACLDSDNPAAARAWPAAGAAADKKARYFGRAWTWMSVACATWPAEDDGRYAGPWDAATASPVLVVGNRYDPATPYQGAERVARLLPSSRLLTLDGYGHTALGKSACIDSAVSAYVVAGELPREGTVCTPDVAPFEGAAEPVPAAAADGRQVARQQVVAANMPPAVQR